jgi:myosin-5
LLGIDEFSLSNTISFVCSPVDTLSAIGIQKGETKVFLRQKAFDCMEAVRTQQLSATATDLERVARGFLARRRYMHTMEKIVLTQACLRRFLARKYLQAVRERKAATTIQSAFKMSKTKDQFVKKRAVAVWCQKMQRGRMARTEYAVLDEKRREARAAAKIQNDSATKIQNMYRSKVARDQLVILKHQKMESDKARGTKFTPEEQVIFQKLEEQQRKAAIAAARATAVAKETAYSKDKEVEMLRKELAESREMLKSFQKMKIEFADTRAELEITKDELKASRSREEVAKTRLAALGAENDKLKQQMEQGAFFDATGGYKSVHYNEYSDLKQLDERIHGIAHRSRQGRKDLHALVQSLAILK